jgi:type VI secretion system protein ImpB
MSSKKHNKHDRVTIEYKLETNGSDQLVNIPHVMGVLGDYGGKSTEKKPLNERKFEDIDSDNFDARMKAVQPRATFRVPNTLTGDGQLSVDIRFERLEDFEPANVAKQIEPLSRLLEARQQLSNLLSYMDGKPGAEKLLADLLKNPELLTALAKTQKPENDIA